MIGARDTSAAARDEQLRAFRRLSPAERVALACQMSDEARALAADGLRGRNPNLTATQLQVALRELLLGPELAHRVNHVTRHTTKLTTPS